MASAAPDDLHLQSAAAAALQISISADLISSSTLLLRFLHRAAAAGLTPASSLLLQSIRRYKSCWLPLAARSRDLLPPIDVQWIWLCHCLNSKSYRRFCQLHYSKIIDLPVLYDPARESSARERCRVVWKECYPDEPFDIEISERRRSPGGNRRHVFQTHSSSLPEDKELMEIVVQESRFYMKVSQPYIYHEGFLKVAEERYKCFLYLFTKLKGRINYVPTFDIQLMWKSHQIYPALYALDISRLHVNPEEIDFQLQEGENMLLDFEDMARTWELLFGHPYERAGAIFPRSNIAANVPAVDTFPANMPISINWGPQIIDLNSKHESLTPRHVMEVCIYVKGEKAQSKQESDEDELFLRFQMMEACKSWRHSVPVSSYMYENAWHRLSSMLCEVSSKGLILELRSHRIACLKGISQLLGTVSLTWNELESEVLFEKKNSFSIKRTDIMESLITLTSITPRVQAPYLLKALNDRVTDDTGAMLSKRLTRLNKYKPQEGRWISWTVLDHTGKECFIIRIRVASGVWRKNERPIGVDWNERTIHVHGGGWNYISGSVGTSPENILATAMPVGDELEQYKMKWSLSTGETLTIQMPIENPQWEKNLGFSVKGSSPGMVRLLNGRRMQYEVPCTAPEEEEGYVTLVRYTTESRQGRATALFNWKISAMEVLPEEDVVFVMLLCIATQRSVADLGGRILHNVYKRRTVWKQRGRSDWGAIVMGEGKDTPPECMRWYVNPEDVLGVNLADADHDEVLPKGASYQIYRGTSWLHGGSSRGLYTFPSKGSSESFGSDRFFGLHFGSQTKFPSFSH